jgi:hypothetical protein
MPQDRKNQVSDSSTKLNRFIDEQLAKWDWIWVPTGAAIIFIVGLFFLRGWLPWFNKPAIDTQVAMAGVIVVAEVGWFAVISSFHARRQANLSLRALVVAENQAAISDRALQLALNAEYNAASPVIRLVASPLVAGGISVTCENVGRGPALNFQCWIECDGFDSLLAPLNRRNATAMGAEGQVPFLWEGGIKPPGMNLRLPSFKDGLDIIAQYDDVFGRPFESRLEIVNDVLPQRLSYGRIEDPKKDRRQW